MFCSDMGGVMKKIMWGMAALVAMQSAMAAEHVWRYVDAKSGQVTYSNVEVKGSKGEKMEIMSYPSPSVSAATAAVGAPIPADVLRQLQGAQRSGSLPTGLPPLPSLPGARLPSGAPLGSPAPVVAARAEPLVDESLGAPEPKWAREVPAAAGPSPKWASEPFSAKK